MLTRSIFVLLLTMIFSCGYSQSCHSYFSIEEGAQWVMESYDKKNNYLSKSIKTVKKTTTDAAGMYTSNLQGEVLDDNDIVIGTIDYVVKCLEGNFFISMNSFLNPEQMSAYQNMEVVIDGDFLELPSHLEPGMTLPDAAIKVKVQSSGVAIMNMTIEILNRQVEKFESITSPAGTFECVKITYTTQSKMGAEIPINISGSGAEWLAKNTGLVKSEQYDNSQNLVSYTLLAEFRR